MGIPMISYYFLRCIMGLAKNRAANTEYYLKKNVKSLSVNRDLETAFAALDILCQFDVYRANTNLNPNGVGAPLPIRELQFYSCIYYF